MRHSPGTAGASQTQRTGRRRTPTTSARKIRLRKRSRSARRVAGTCRTTRACPAVRSRSPEAPRRPTHRQVQSPDRTGTTQAAPAQQCQSTRRSATSRFPPSKHPWSATPPPVSSCGQRGRRNVRRTPSRWDGRRRPRQTVASEASVAVAGSFAGKNSFGKNEDRGRRVDVEVEELNRRADQAREQDLPRAVDRRAGQPTTKSWPFRILQGRGFPGHGANSPSLLVRDGVETGRARCSRTVPLTVSPDYFLAGAAALAGAGVFAAAARLAAACASRCSSARAPARMPTIEMFPSWQAYS